MLVYFVLEILLIVAYLRQSAIAGLLVWAVIAVLVFRYKKNGIDFWVKLIIYSLPISYLEISGEPGLHIFKWYNFAVLGLQIYTLLYLVKHPVSVNKSLLFGSLLFLAIQFIRTSICNDRASAARELLQEYITIISMLLFLMYLKSTRRVVSYEDISEEWMSAFNITTMATAVGVILQFLLYNMGIQLGSMTLWESRHVFDLTFTGYSVLSCYLGCGLVLSTQSILFRHRKNFAGIVSMVICVVACALNTSRSGFFAAIIVVYIMVYMALKRKSSFVKAILFLLPISAILIFGVYLMVQNRSSLQASGLIFANGRDALVRLAVDTMLNNGLFTFLFGLGINASGALGVPAQHNMFLEMWVLNGTLLTIIFIAAIICLLVKTKNSKGRYLLWTILIAHQFYSSFFATTFLLPILILAVSSSQLDSVVVTPNAGT